MRTQSSILWLAAAGFTALAGCASQFLWQYVSSTPLTTVVGR